MSKFVVTGASGFVGSRLVKDLLAAGHEVVCVGRSDEQHTPLPCISYTFHDLDWSAIGHVDGVFHQAAITNTLHAQAEDFYKVNFQYSKALFLDAARNGCTFIVYASSCAVYGNVEAPFREDGPKKPLNPYGESKLQLDDWAMRWAKEASVRVVGLRYSNVYGPGESHKGKSSSMVYQLMKQMMKGERPKLFEHGEQKRDFVHIEDVVRANRLAMVGPTGVYNVGSGSAVEFNRIVKIINELNGTNLETEYIPNTINGVFQNHTQCDLFLSGNRLGYKPQYDIESGISGYYQYSKRVD